MPGANDLHGPLLTLLRVGRVFTPQESDFTDILVADGRIAALGRNLDVPTGWPVEVVEARDATAVPAFIDQHVHVTGGGGEGGFATRCPPITAADIASRGIGTVVGVLGTDSVSRSPADLLAGVRGLRAAGIDAYMYTGAYRVPPPTLTGDIQRDLAWIPEVIGVGEVAISDHRSSQPRQDELERLVADARVGAMLAGKRGICHFHLGDGERGLEPLRRLLMETEIPAEQVIPTHVNRHHELLEEAAEYAKDFGACVDVTAFEARQTDPAAEPAEDEFSAFNAVHTLLTRGVPASRITISSDCNGSAPEFDEQGNLVAMGIGGNTAFLRDWQRLITEEVLTVERALELITTNVARVLGLHRRKGALAPGYDADVTLLNDAYQPRRTVVRGRSVDAVP